MANFSKILGLASTAVVFAGMAFGQTTCITGTALQTPLIRTEGTTELVGEYYVTCGVTGSPGGVVNILGISSLPVTSKLLTSSSTGASEITAIVATGSPQVPTVVGTYQATYSGSNFNFSGVVIPSGVSYIIIANVRVNANTLPLTGTPSPVNESAFVTVTTASSTNSTLTGPVPVAYGLPGLGAQTVYNGTLATSPATAFALTSGNKGAPSSFLVCQGYKSNAGLIGVIDVGEAFATAFKGVGSSNPTVGSEFTNNTETGFTGISGSVSNVASSGTLIQVVFSGIPAQVTSLYVPITVATDNSTAATPVAGTGSLVLVTSPSNLTTPTAATAGSSVPSGIGSANSVPAAISISSGSATAYYLFVPGTASVSTQETFAIPAYVVTAANASNAATGTITAAVSFAPVGSTQLPNFSIQSSTTTSTLAAFSGCTTSLLFPFVTNQLGFDTGIAIANTSSDPFGSKGATAQAGTCTLNFYGAGAPSPSNVATPSVPSGTVYTAVLSSVAAGFQGYLIAQCNFQYAHGFAFVTDGVGANGGLSQGYLAGVIPDTNQVSRATANPIGSVTKTGQGETLGN